MEKNKNQMSNSIAMTQQPNNKLSTQIRSRAPLFLAVAVAFFAYEAYLLSQSFSADLRIYNNAARDGFTFWETYWVSSELVGEVGLIVRFAGSCLFLAFPILLLLRHRLTVSVLRKAVLLEAIQYLFFLPFNSYMLLHPFASFSAALVSYEAAISYLIQLCIITPIFLMLYLQLRKPTLEWVRVYRWGAFAAVGFLFSLWVKHFMFNFYALPIDFSNSTLTVGFFNSAFTMLVAALLLTFALMPTIQRAATPNWKVAGTAFCVVSVYFFIYIAIAASVDRYMWYLTLTELWAVSMLVAGVGFLIHKAH